LDSKVRGPYSPQRHSQDCDKANQYDCNWGAAIHHSSLDMRPAFYHLHKVRVSAVFYIPFSICDLVAAVTTGIKGGRSS
jgi:hypothetical protein